MNKTILTLIVFCLSLIAKAGSPPITTCSNEGGTIKISQGTMSVLINKYPSEEFETINLGEININEQFIQQMPNEELGCTSRQITFKVISFTKKDGSKMPDAYNLLSLDGVLKDYFICATKHTWNHGEGNGCFGSIGTENN